MAHNGHGGSYEPEVGDIDEDLWGSPSEKDVKPKTSKDEPSHLRAGGSQIHTGRSKYEDGESKEVALQTELESVRKVNEAIEGVIASLDKAKSSMKVSLFVFYPLMRAKILLVSLSIIQSTPLALSLTPGRGSCRRPSTIKNLFSTLRGKEPART